MAHGTECPGSVLGEHTGRETHVRSQAPTPTACSCSSRGTQLQSSPPPPREESTLATPSLGRISTTWGLEGPSLWPPTAPGPDRCPHLAPEGVPRETESIPSISQTPTPSHAAVLPSVLPSKAGSHSAFWKPVFDLWGDNQTARTPHCSFHPHQSPSVHPSVRPSPLSAAAPPPDLLAVRCLHLLPLRQNPLEPGAGAAGASVPQARSICASPGASPTGAPLHQTPPSQTEPTAGLWVPQ